MSSNKYVEVFPNKIILSKQLGQSFFDSKLTLTNVLDSYVVFKVYINKSTQYSANPSTSFLKPRESVVINIKRVEKDITQNQTSRDKFLILAFPVNKVIQDTEEAKQIIKTSDLKAKTNQEIYLEAEYSQETADGRKSMFVKSLNRLGDANSPFDLGNISNNPSILNESVQTAQAGNYSSYDATSSINASKLIYPGSTLSELDETKKQIEEIKKNIQNYDSEINKLNVMLTNYSSNSMLYKTKNKVLPKDQDEKSGASDKFPLSFVILLLTLGLTLGAYANRLISS